MKEFTHKSVLLEECIRELKIDPEGVYIDGTLGGAGHSFEIAKRLTTGRLIGFDQDADAIEASSKRLGTIFCVTYFIIHFTIHSIMR